VFIFWLASAATHQDLFSKDPEVTGIPTLLAEAMTALFNKHYKAFFINEIYFTAFVLDPRASILDGLRWTDFWESGLSRTRSYPSRNSNIFRQDNSTTIQ